MEELASPTQSEAENGSLVASSLLRTFYVNRESVIRTPAAAPNASPAAATEEIQKQQTQQQQQQQHSQQHQLPQVVTAPYSDHHPHQHLPQTQPPHPDSGGGSGSSSSHNMLTPPGSHDAAMASSPYFSAPPPLPHHSNFATKASDVETDDHVVEANDNQHHQLLKSPPSYNRLYSLQHHHQLAATMSPDGYHANPHHTLHHLNHHQQHLHHQAESPAASGLYSVDLNMTPPSSVSPQVQTQNHK